jgi:hypothetical protein
VGRGGAASFRTLEAPFDHGSWTGFPLDGAHAAAACSACHPTLPRAESTGRTFSRAKGSACADCHSDPHVGQFVENGRVDCRRCHESTVRFADLAFNHNLESRFPLGDTHGGVPCASCHVPFDHAGASIVRYKPLSRECVDCHGDNAQPLKKKRGSRDTGGVKR